MTAAAARPSAARAVAATGLALLTGLTALAAGGCTVRGVGQPQAGSPGTVRTTPTARSAASSAAPSPTLSTSSAIDGCFTAATGKVTSAHLPGGESLTVGIMGAGRDVVILSNQSDEDLCSWLPFARKLAAEGYRVVLWDYGTLGSVNELSGLARWLRAAGATRIVLMGASEGAKTSIVAGARILPAVRGVVSLSAEEVLLPSWLIVRWVPRLRSPLLLVTAATDPYGSELAAHDFLRAPASGPRQLVKVAGSDHGTALLSGRAARTVVPAVLAFLRQVLGR